MPTLIDVWATVRHLLIGLLVLAFVTMPWSVVAGANLHLSPRVPWAIPIGLIYLGLAVAYLSGRGRPATTAGVRRSRFRARWLTGAESFWSLLAGVSAIACLWLLFAAFGGLGGETPPGREATLPAAVLFMFVVVSSAATAIGEEGGLRGFMQAPLERRFGPTAAIAASTVAFVLIHATHGIPALVRAAPIYAAAGVVYGLLSYLTQSILPALALHFLGDVVAFGLRSSLIHLSGPRTAPAVALSIAGAIVASGIAILAFGRLRAVSATTRISRLSDPDAA
ncbi:MAG: CPBP family intramembrane metalloprotease [Acidobacteriia bacterium]|nr:CPBP family intramembrane metalloprotease [Terriglobia bacterium]